jgi:uncharacterized protein (DUF58 family)
MPSKRALLLFGAAPLLFVGALWIPLLEAVAWAVNAGLLLLLGLDLAVTPRRNAFRVFLHAPQVCSVVHTERLRVDVENDSGLAGAAELRVVFPAHLSPSEFSQRCRLRRRDRTPVDLEFMPERRGRYEVGPVYLRYASALGLFCRSLRFEERRELRVFPAVASIKKFQLLARRLRVREMGFRPRRTRGQGMEFARLREYHHDDDMRLVDWKATARHDRLISREYQVERSQTIVLMIDAGRMLTEEVDGIVKIEYALTAAILLTRIAADYDDRVGALVFSDRVERSCVPRKGRAAIEAVTKTLYDVEPKLVESDYEAAFRHLHLNFRKRALVVLFTNIVDPGTSALTQAYLTALSCRHLPLCVAIGDRETQALADLLPTDEESVYRKAAAVQLLAQRRTTIHALRRHGVLVVDAAAGEVPPQLVNAYLDLKSRQLL